MLIGLLEDDLAIQEMLRILLQGEGHQVRAYLTAADCLADLHVTDPLSASPARLDLLLVDWHLAKSVPGTAVIEQIRANPRLASLPVILMTASTVLSKQELDALQVTLLVKPFDIDEVVRLVNELTSC